MDYKNTFKWITITLIALLIIIFDIGYFNVIKNTMGRMGNKVIVIDAGHGGIDGGAIGKGGTLEKEINLSISKKLKAYIEEGGNTAIMIREVDEGLYSEYGSVRKKKIEDLKNRKEIIEEYGADIFISIHLNYFSQSQYYGAQVFYEKGNKESERLARITQSELIKTLDRGNRRVEKPSDTYYMLNNNSIPSIIVECGFLSNPEEEILLRKEEYQNKIAWAVYTGAMRYIAEPETN